MKTSTYLDCKPTFEHKKISYFREEKENYLTIRPGNISRTSELIVNDTSRDFMKLCDGKKTVKDIIEEIFITYNNPPRELVERDLSNFLKVFSEMDLISWDDDNPFFEKYEYNFNKDHTCQLCSKKEFSVIAEFIDKHELKTSKSSSDEYLFYYSPFLRDQMFTKKYINFSMYKNENYYIILRKNHLIQGILCMNNHNQIHKLPNIQFLYINRNNIYRKDFLLYSFNLFPVIDCEISGIRVFEEIQNPVDIQLKELLFECGFTLNCTLFNELGFGKDIREYMLYL